jgi:hypothetical protein
MWYDEKCMSSVAQKNINRRCHRKVKDNSDFCGYHQRSKKYHPPLLKTIRRNDLTKYNAKINIRSLNTEVKTYISQLLINDIIQRLQDTVDMRNKTLDEKYKYSLMDMYDSWSTVPFTYQIKLDDHWWHIELIIYHIVEQLNHSNMENSYPIYPSNPFTREPFSPISMSKLKESIQTLKLPINIALYMFLNFDVITLQKCYTQSVNNNDRHSVLLDAELRKHLRYKLINSRDSQSNLMGYWVLKKEDKSTFENLYDAWKDTPYQIICPVTYNIIPNFQKQHLYNLLNKSHVEQWGPVSDINKIKVQ